MIAPKGLSFEISIFVENPDCRSTLLTIPQLLKMKILGGTSVLHPGSVTPFRVAPAELVV
jgi:hypothetical protein